MAFLGAGSDLNSKYKSPIPDEERNRLLGIQPSNIQKGDSTPMGFKDTLGLLGAVLGPGKYWKGAKALGTSAWNYLKPTLLFSGGISAYNALKPKSDEEIYQQKLYNIDQQQSKQDSLHDIRQYEIADSLSNSFKNRFK